MNSGIYKIENSLTKDFYIGSTVSFTKRKSKHFKDLERNLHPNSKLQNAYNKYNGEFLFLILAVCPKEYLIKMEQWFIDNLKPKYNIRKIAESNLGLNNSEESKIKASIAHKGKSKSFNCNPIISIDLDTKERKEFISTIEAAKYYNCHPTSITRVLTGKRYSNNGYRFEYKKGPKRNNVKLIQNNNKEGQKFLKKRNYDYKN